MSEQSRDWGVLDDVDTAIRREVEIIAERFPDTDVAVVDAAVREVYEGLRADADVETHLLALTRHRVYDRLQEQGHAFHPPTANETEPDATAPTGPTPD